MRVLPAGFVPPCLPTKAQEPPSGPMWLHEIKHDGFRVIARKDDKRVRLYRRTPASGFDALKSGGKVVFNARICS
jgi:ATP-dependent DNA ligase